MRPFITVLADGNPVNGLFYQRLISASIRDESGQESDTVEVEFDNRGGVMPLPEEGAVLEPFFGYRETGTSTMGKFVVDGYSSGGGTCGRIFKLTARAADLRETLKQKRSEHFEKTTVGAMLKKAFECEGVTIEVEASLAGIAIEYEPRFDQSTLDFATRLADKHNALFKPGGGTMLFVPRGHQGKLSGGIMTGITLRPEDCSDWEISGKPRQKYGKAAAKYYDPATGETKFESFATGQDGPIRMLKRKFRDRAEAKRAATAEGTRLNRGKASGFFSMEGLLTATAEIDVTAIGFGPIEDGLWRGESVEQRFNGGGFRTTINVESLEVTG